MDLGVDGGWADGGRRDEGITRAGLDWLQKSVTKVGEGTCSRSLLGVRGDEHGEKGENEGGQKHGDRRLKGEVGGFS
jgi:hypothetical protein